MPSTSAELRPGWRGRAAVLVSIGLLVLTGSGCGATAGPGAAQTAVRAQTAGATSTAFLTVAARTRAQPRTGPSRQPRPSLTPKPSPSTKPPFAVGERVVTFVDHSRAIRFPGRSLEPRTLVTVIRYPAQGPARPTDVRDGAPLRSAGRFPLVVFGHGFAVTPAYYARLLRAWAGAGYIVAAPVFPLGNEHAPGGPDESDIVNQPRDMSFVITRLLAASADPRAPFASLIDPRRIAVSGQSDGGETALAVAYDRFYLDRRVGAAMILSGAVIPGVAGFDFPAPSPPLLATQGTADTINQPAYTDQFFNLAPAPKYLLQLLGAPHLSPYTYEQPQLGIVEQVTIAFLDHYLKRLPGSLTRMLAEGGVSGTSTIGTGP